MIPEWNISGVIPPIRPGKSGNDPDRSPYLVTLSTLVDRFGSISKERREILRGLFLYREELHKIGVKSGVQWLDEQETKEALDILNSYEQGGMSND